ncbi:Ergosterol biosynthetic protein 28 [Dendrobium catenatum]|uniref:Ergosterol biosynthetic protein 28 n=1 Tax=Dendrobium catenatum TaxID=906689 RepID=A0A2I0WKQ4_9ASPA|nr:Ergosterol biosynthetic protein 28 [Dendrobium catenatum]
MHFDFFFFQSIKCLVLHAVTDIHGRTFGVWTLLTCTLCLLCALNLENKPLYLATFLSFVYALGHFLTEYWIYHTMALPNLTTVGIFAGKIDGRYLFFSYFPFYDGFFFCSLARMVHVLFLLILCKIHE